jgi:hypothetical protein
MVSVSFKVNPKMEVLHEKQNRDFGGTRTLGTCVGFEHLCFSQERKPVHFSGLINDYSPAGVKGGPCEMHGQWTLDLHRESGTAEFSADMTMSGYGKTTAGAVDPTQAGVNPHTHDIRLTNVTVIWDLTGCPAYLPPATITGFRINGTVSLLTGNGSIAHLKRIRPHRRCRSALPEGTMSRIRSRIRTLS